MKYCRWKPAPKKEPVFWVLKYLQHLDQSLILNYDWSNHPVQRTNLNHPAGAFANFLGNSVRNSEPQKQKKHGKIPHEIREKKCSMTFRFFPYLNHVFVFQKKWHLGGFFVSPCRPSKLSRRPFCRAWRNGLGKRTLGNLQNKAVLMLDVFWSTWRIIPVSKWLVSPIYKPFCFGDFKYLEDHPMTCKWLITMVIVSPLRIGLFPGLVSG